MGTADLSSMMGEKCFKWSQVMMTATWKLMRLVERRVEGQGPRLANAETQIQGLFFNLLLFRTLANEQCYRIDPRKPGSAGAKQRVGEEGDPPGEEDHSSDGRVPSFTGRASGSSGERRLSLLFEGF